MKQMILFIGLILLVGCNSGRTERVGNDRDGHGCIGSAGYVWSVVRNQCVRPWEVGLQLEEVTTKRSYQSGASGVFSTNFNKVELFLPSADSSLILKRFGDEWKDAQTPWRLVRHPSQVGRQELWELLEGDVVRFQAKPILTQPLYEAEGN